MVSRDDRFYKAVQMVIGLGFSRGYVAKFFGVDRRTVEKWVLEYKGKNIKNKSILTLQSKV